VLLGAVVRAVASLVATWFKEWLDHRHLRKRVAALLRIEIRARAAVEQQVVKWNKELTPTVENPTVAAEIRTHVSRLKDGDRLAFVTSHIADAGPAVLHGPSFLSGLTPAEQEIVRRQYEARINPEASEAKTKTLEALAHCEQGWRNASNQIWSRAGLDKVGNRAGAMPQSLHLFGGVSLARAAR
jgi:hypothetical protein